MEGHTQGHVKRKIKTFYFIYPKFSIFVPDTEKCLFPWLIHLRYETENSLKIRKNTLNKEVSK